MGYIASLLWTAANGKQVEVDQHVGEQLEELFSERLGEVSAELAHHFEESRDWRRAVDYLQLVAGNVGRRFAHHEATEILQHALKLVRKLPEAEPAGIETEILAKLATIYLVSFDMRVVETFETLAARAAEYGLIDMEVRALIDTPCRGSVLSVVWQSWNEPSSSAPARKSR
jgi:hypothetical protein